MALAAAPAQDPAAYEAAVRAELELWRRAVLRGPSLWDRTTRGVQNHINRVIPEKVHAVVTAAIERMTRSILAGAEVVTGAPRREGSLQARETAVRERLGVYRATAAAEGGLAGAGGVFLAAADFPVLMGIKLKLLFDVAALYGHDTADLRERLYILHIFQLAFSSARGRPRVYAALVDWRERREDLPLSLHNFDWRTFQQEYRDYIDLAKLAQLLPVVGAPVGALVNWRLMERLGETAMNAYRMRRLDN